MRTIRKVCSVESCSNPARSKGYCSKHYKQVYRHGRLTPEKEHRDTCRIQGCNRKHKARGYCSTHYRELLSHGEIRQRTFKPVFCALVDCNEKAKSRGFCTKHYNFYLTNFVQNGYSWDQVDKIVIKRNQKTILKRNRLKLLKQRHTFLKKQSGMMEKEEILMDVLVDEDMDPGTFIEIKRDLEEDEFWPEALENENCDLLEEELFHLRKSQGQDEDIWDTAGL